MKFTRLYRISFYAMLFLATLSLSIDADTDHPVAWLFPPAVAIASAIALLTVDRNPRLGLSRRAANLLSLGSFALSGLEFWYDENYLILALGHLLVYLQVIKIFLPKTNLDDWFLFLLALTQVLIGAFIGQADRVGIILMGWALVSLWTLGLFHLQREAGRVQTAPGVTIQPHIDPSEPYPGLIDAPFVLTALKVAGTTLALGGLIFLIMPRWGSPKGSQKGRGSSLHLSGFSSEVRLGQIGEILENDSVVMSIELYNEENQRTRAGEEPLWRGVSMASYEGGRWFRQPVSPLEFQESKFQPELPLSYLRQEIRLESTDSDVLFGLHPVQWASGGDLVLNKVDGMIYREGLHPNIPYVARVNLNPGPFQYRVISSPDANPNETMTVQPGERFPYRRRREHRSPLPVPNSLSNSLERLLAPTDKTDLSLTKQQLLDLVEPRLLDVPEPLKTHLAEFSAPFVADLSEDQWKERALTLEWMLKSSGRYTYSLRMDRVNRSIDPVEDFLINRKQGHCEYFASALALMLRSINIPTRLINGFKGGDWNELGQVMVVRQKHAHSWVEALVGRSDEGHPIWLTLDPTPAAGREQVVSQVGGLSRRFRPLSDYIRYLWVFYVAGFNQERQKRLIYDPFWALVADAKKGFALMGKKIRRLLIFPDINSFFSVRGFLVSFFLMLLIVGIVRLIVWIDRTFSSRFRRSTRDSGDLAAEVATFRRLAQLLAEFGLERPPGETPLEFAQRAADSLALRGEEVQSVSDVPKLVVNAFYGIRFGNHQLSPERLQHLETRLDDLESSLRLKASY